ncbi:MAG: hypothetical protein PUP90_26855 [Nostoc sp. S4]|nr:hypothetical protein [Nostoc sp. S4]
MRILCSSFTTALVFWFNGSPSSTGQLFEFSCCFVQVEVTLAVAVPALVLQTPSKVTVLPSLLTVPVFSTVNCPSAFVEERNLTLLPETVP